MRTLHAATLTLVLCACSSKGPPAATKPPEPTQRTQAANTRTPASSRSVKIPAKGLTLEGTLELPAGEGPFPGVVLVHGSGPNSRDQMVPGLLGVGFPAPMPLFRDLAKQLTSQGVAVLRYDKRSCYAKNGCENSYPEPSAEIVIQDFVDDAVAALRYLSSVERIDPKRLVVVGHSQGAGLVPIIMKQMPEIRAGVAIAPPGSSFSRTLRSQVDKSLSMVPASQMKLAQTQVQPILNEVKKIERIEQGETLKAPVLGAPPAFMKSQVQAAKEALKVASTIERPIVAIRGTQDWNIPKADFDEWKAALTSSSYASKHRVVELPEITHALTRLAQPDPSKIQPKDIETSVHPSVSTSIVEAIVPGPS